MLYLELPIQVEVLKQLVQAFLGRQAKSLELGQWRPECQAKTLEELPRLEYR